MKFHFDIAKLAIVIACAAVISAAYYGVMRPYSYNSSNLASLGNAFAETLDETESYDTSPHEFFWLNSGAQAKIQGTTTLRTLRGDLEEGSYWQKIYMAENPMDTENGIHPQNLFRLFTKATYGDGSYQAYFKINRIILSQSPNRNESNGVLIMFHATDNDDLYYAGLRVDGTGVIKKKVGGTYHTLSEVPAFAYAKYNKDSMPNLLPLQIWLGVKVNVRTMQNGEVDIALYTDIGGTGIWVPLTHVVDTPQDGVPTLPAAAHAGLRTDFMEVDMRDFRVTSL